jgi:precorrin-6B methylase 2
MLRKICFCGWLTLAVAAVVAAQGCAKKVAPGKQITVKVLLSQPETKFLAGEQEIEANKVEGKEKDGKEVERMLTITLPPGKDHVVVKAIWDPNNYTKITRPRKVVDKPGEIVLDFRKPSDDEKDDIVVRFVPTPDEFVAAMCKMANVGKDDVVYDLGCGDGRMVITAVKDFNAKRGVGVELDGELVKKSKAAAETAGVADKVDIRQGDVLKVDDISDATVVLLYMGDDINKRLKPILQKTLKPGSRVVSHRFLMGEDWPPLRSEKLRAMHGEYPGYENEIHLWVIEEKK